MGAENFYLESDIMNVFIGSIYGMEGMGIISSQLRIEYRIPAFSI